MLLNQVTHCIRVLFHLELHSNLKIILHFRHQQAIADWQSWADNQSAEFSNLQTSLNQYAEAYNAVTTELAALQAATSAGQAGDDAAHKDEEIAKLKAAVRAKEIEIVDLVS